MTLHFASHNENKIREIQMMSPSGVLIRSLNDLNFEEEIDENGQTIEENAIIKATTIFNQFKIAVFADDTGLEVDAISGEPGVYSARYAGKQKNNEDNIDLLLQRLSIFPNHDQRTARFKTVICLIDSTGKKNLFTGTAEGNILPERRGTGGFGYDAVFLPTGFDQTFAEMNAEQKNKISHRYRAFEKLINHLNLLS